MLLPKEAPEAFLGPNDLPPQFGVVNWVLPPCLNDPKGDYMDHLRRLQLKMKIPGSEWDIGALQRMQKLEEQPLTAPYLTVPAVIRAAAEAAVPEFKAKSQELEEEAQEIGIPADPAVLDA